MTVGQPEISPPEVNRPAMRKSGISKSGMKWVLSKPPIATLTRLTLTLVGLAGRAASAVRSAAVFGHTAIPVCHHSVTLKYPARIVCHEGVIIGPKSTLGAAGGIVLERNVRISEGVMIETAGLDFSQSAPYPHIVNPIHIEADVWIGTRAIILGGVRIGRGAVVGAGVVVSQNVPAGAVVVGQPARVRTVKSAKAVGANTEAINQD